MQYSCQVYIYILRMEKHLKFLLQTKIAYSRTVSWFWPKFILAISRSLEERSLYGSAHTFILNRHWKFLLHIKITWVLMSYDLRVVIWASSKSLEEKVLYLSNKEKLEVPTSHIKDCFDKTWGCHELDPGSVLQDYSHCFKKFMVPV